jgi:hypothetical protein
MQRSETLLSFNTAISKIENKNDSEFNRIIKILRNSINVQKTDTGVETVDQVDEKSNMEVFVITNNGEQVWEGSAKDKRDAIDRAIALLEKGPCLMPLKRP